MGVILQHQIKVAILLSCVSCLMRCQVCGNNSSSKHSLNGKCTVSSVFLNLIVSVECGQCLALTLVYHEMCSILLIKALFSVCWFLYVLSLFSS